MKKYKYTKSFRYEGKRYYVRGDTLDEVYEKKQKKLHELKNGMITFNGDMPFEQWARIAIETYKSGIKEESRMNTIYKLNSCVFPDIGSVPIKNIKPLQLQRIMNKQAEMSKSHVNQLRIDLRFVFRKAVENKMILENPADNLVLPDNYDNERRSLTDHEREHYEKIADVDKRFLLFDLMLYCGCRPAEGIRAKGFDIQDMDGYHVLHIRGTKSAKSDRFVPIPDNLYGKIKNTENDKNIVVTERGNQLTKKAYQRLSNRLRRELNISMGCQMYRNKLIPPFPLADDFVPYFFRHTFCTDLATKGVDIRTAQYLMGHSDIQMTANIYTHVQANHITAAAELLGATKGATE